MHNWFKAVLQRALIYFLYLTAEYCSRKKNEDPAGICHGSKSWDRSKIEMLWSLYSIHPLVIFQKSCKWLSEIILNGQLIKYSTHQSNHLNRWNTYYINNVFKCMSTVCDRKRCVSKTSHPAWTSWIVWADTEQFEQIRKAIFSLLNTEIYSM